MPTPLDRFRSRRPSPSATRRRRLRPLPAAAALVLAVLAAPPVEAACLRAVFFDIGNTLAERREDGLFLVRAGARETIDQLRAAGVEIGVITNVPAGWTRTDLEALLAEPEFLDQFDVLVMSSQAPARKPDPQIYLLAHGLLATPVPIGETAFVGETLAEIADSENDPTSGARAVGMVGIHLSDTPASPLADHTIPTRGLTEIVTLRANLCGSVADGVEPGDNGRSKGGSLGHPGV